MQSILRDFLLSFGPAKVRQVWRPSSQLTVLRAARWSGAAQFLLTALVLIGQFKHFFIARSQQMAPHMGSMNSTGEAGHYGLVVLEFLFHPLSFFLLYLAWKVQFALLAASLPLRSSPACLFFFSSNYLIPRHDQSAGTAWALRWQMLWRASQTAGYALLLHAQSQDGTPASPLALMVSGLRWNGKSTPSRRVHTYMFSVPRRRERFCAVTRNTPRRRWRLSP